MSAQSFAAVRVQWGRTGVIRHVTSIREAAECLMEWPTEGGDKLQAAKVAVLSAHDGDGDVDMARRAFAAAAGEAGILLPDLPGRQSALRQAVSAHKHRVIVGLTRVKNDRLMTKIEMDGKHYDVEPWIIWKLDNGAEPEDFGLKPIGPG